MYNHMQAGMVLKRGLRVLYLDMHTTEFTMSHTGHSSSIEDLKACPNSGTLPPSGPHLVIVPPSMG